MADFISPTLFCFCNADAALCISRCALAEFISALYNTEGLKIRMNEVTNRLNEIIRLNTPPNALKYKLIILITSKMLKVDRIKTEYNLSQLISVSYRVRTTAVACCQK